jgi:SAM-dependent methyltransferase
MPAYLHEPIHPETFTRDDCFDKFYSPGIQQLSERHWTPSNISKRAAAYLAEDDGAQILDIGAGVGKFCLIAAQQQPSCHFYGIEQRKNLVHFAEKAGKKLALGNVTFLHGNFTNIDLSQFDHFYFYNSFYENLVDEECRIDEHVTHSVALYDYYTQFLRSVFTQRPSGTKIATYYSYKEVVPDDYRLVNNNENTFLRFWIKE